MIDQEVKNALVDGSKKLIDRLAASSGNDTLSVYLAALERLQMHHEKFKALNRISIAAALCFVLSELGIVLLVLRGPDWWYLFVAILCSLVVSGGIIVQVIWVLYRMGTGD